MTMPFKYLTGVVFIDEDGNKVIYSPDEVQLIGALLTASGKRAIMTVSSGVAARHVGALNGAAIPYYLVGTEEGMIPTLGGTTAISADQILLQPCLFQRKTTIDRIITKRSNTVLPGQNMKYCVYKSTSLTSLYPSPLVAYSGSIAPTAVPEGAPFGYQYSWVPTTPLVCDAGVLYYFGLKTDGVLNNMWGVNATSLRNYLGCVWDISYNGIVHYTGVATAAGAQPFANAFPDPFPASQTLAQYSNFAIGLRITAQS